MNSSKWKMTCAKANLSAVIIKYKRNHRMNETKSMNMEHGHSRWIWVDSLMACVVWYLHVWLWSLDAAEWCDTIIKQIQFGSNSQEKWNRDENETSNYFIHLHCDNESGCLGQKNMTSLLRTNAMQHTKFNMIAGESHYFFSLVSSLLLARVRAQNNYCSSLLSIDELIVLDCCLVRISVSRQKKSQAKIYILRIIIKFVSVNLMRMDRMTIQTCLYEFILGSTDTMIIMRALQTRHTY